MSFSGRRSCSYLGSIAAAVIAASAMQAQINPTAAMQVTRPVNESQLVTRLGNVHPAVYAPNTVDRGRVDDSLQFDHLLLQLQRAPAQEQAMQSYIHSLGVPNSPNYHHFLMPAQFSQMFGLAPSDITAVTDWLASHGFIVNGVYPNLVVDFSGTARQVREAFHTEIHNLAMDGEAHIANVSDPQIPAALAGVVKGPVALHDFKPHPLTHMGIKPSVTNPNSNYTTSAGYQLLVPGDLQTIYNYNPLYAAGYSGTGQTIILLERTDLYSTGDWNTFRKVFGLTRAFPHGSLTTVHPGGKALDCADPGVLVGDDGEAAVDVEWASASAPNATIEIASCKDTSTNFGAFTALQNILLAGLAPPSASVMSLSYGSPESENGSDGNAYINDLYALAAAEGYSLFVATGDADADVTDQNRMFARHGINVNALASTTYNVAVGGTDYADSFFGINSSYWSATNTLNFESALSYIPEIPWNDSCASQLISLVFTGNPNPTGPKGNCNTSPGNQFLNTAGGSGGPSACAFGDATIPGVVSGTCSGYPKPFWQAGFPGNPSDGVRDLPDVSMFAANGVWGHYFVICYTDSAGGGTPCPSTNPSVWAGAGGTSFGAPIWAGIQALINQATVGAQGNPSPVYYALANAEYSTPVGLAACNSDQLSPSPACVFYDVTLGDNDSVCRADNDKNSPGNGLLFNCYLGGGTNGALSTSNSVYHPAYLTNSGYDFPTGIGTPNVFNLVKAFPGSKLKLP